MKGLRIDKGYLSENNFDYLDEQLLAYVAKVPMYSNIRSYIERITQQQLEEISEFTSVTRKKLLLDDW
ncbi:MAG: hypothetical protein SCK70_05275 [bacterium]|nr:hypothetical protein [bacterium]